VVRTGEAPRVEINAGIDLSSHHWCHDSAARTADTRSNRAGKGESSYATSGTASHGFLQGSASSEANY
jgi:hypothetical protein